MPSDRPTEEWRKQAFDLLAESTKQLITVSTGVVTITILFSKDLDTTPRHIAYAAWVVLIISVMFGVAVLLNLSGNLQNAADGKYRFPSVTATGIRILSKGQIYTFVAGIVLLFAFGLYAVNGHVPPDTKPISVTCVLPPPQMVKPADDGHPKPPIKHHHRPCPCTRKPQVQPPEQIVPKN